MSAVLIFILFGCVFLSAFFSASETAMFSLSSMQIKAYLRSGESQKKLVASLLKRPTDLLVTLLLLNTVVNILTQNIISSLYGQAADWLFNVGVPLAITLIFGEVLPKSIGVYNKEKIALGSASSLQFFEKVFYPIRSALTSIVHWVAPWEFFFLRKKEQISVDELRHALKASHAGGVLNHDEAELIRGYLNLEDASVKELMRPREEVIVYDMEEPLEDLVKLFLTKSCAKIPVCQGGFDKILGIMTAKNFFLHQEKIRNKKDLLPLLKKPFFVPETLPGRSLLKKFYEKKESLALVIDEYSSISGLITFDDLVEIVIGEIADRKGENQKYVRSGGGVIVASGKMELSDLEEVFGISLHSPNHMVTVGGFLTEQIGDIPKSGAKFTVCGLYFHVLAADETRVRRIYIRQLKPGEQIFS